MISEDLTSFSVMQGMVTLCAKFFPDDLLIALGNKVSRGLNINIDAEELTEEETEGEE
jgi:hypothetical protein